MALTYGGQRDVKSANMSKEDRVKQIFIFDGRNYDQDAYQGTFQRMRALSASVLISINLFSTTFELHRLTASDSGAPVSSLTCLTHHRKCGQKDC